MWVMSAEWVFVLLHDTYGTDLWYGKNNLLNKLFEQSNDFTENDLWKSSKMLKYRYGAIKLKVNDQMKPKAWEINYA